MGRPKKVQKPEMGLVRLRRENQELKTENALLKKVKALVEEREARLRDWAGAIRELRQEGH
ncbi:MAG: IS3 family transposase, partial [Muribaculaceae bacterium]|nr:IS3 family transposase [Muribaculaceae bacterium]